MQFKSLKIFCDVVGRRSFSRAASENGISQSGASQVVHQLEERLGVQLLDRSRRPFVLTSEGEAYYAGCRKIVDDYQRLEDAVRGLDQEVAGRVVVASIYSIGLYHMDRLLKEFIGAHPRANVRLEYLHPAEVREAVENDAADLGLLSYPRAGRNLEATEWGREPMVLVAAPDHPLASRRSLSLEDLDGATVVAFDRGLSIRREIDRALQKRDTEVHVAMELDNIETIKRAIEIGAGVGILPEPTVDREVAAGTLAKVSFEDNPLVRPLGVVHRRGRALSVTARRFVERLCAYGAEMQPMAGESISDVPISDDPSADDPADDRESTDPLERVAAHDGPPLRAR